MVFPARGRGRINIILPKSAFVSRGRTLIGAGFFALDYQMPIDMNFKWILKEPTSDGFRFGKLFTEATDKNNDKIKRWR